MNLMTEKEIIGLAFGGAQTTAVVLRIFAALALLGGVLAAAAIYSYEQDAVALAVYVGLWGLLAATLLNALAWVIDLLRGILVGVWHGAWHLDDEEGDDDAHPWPEAS